MQIPTRVVSLLRVVPFVAALTVPACAIDDVDDDVDVPVTSMTTSEISLARHARVCTDGEVRCHARVIVDADGKPVPNATPSGLGPSQLRDAYKITSNGSSATVIAIVDAFGYPNAESDLANYRTTFGLPP